MIHPPLLEQDKLKHIPIVSLTEYTVNTLVEKNLIFYVFIKKTLSDTIVNVVYHITILFFH